MKLELRIFKFLLFALNCQNSLQNVSEALELFGEDSELFDQLHRNFENEVLVSQVRFRLQFFYMFL